MSSRSTDLRRLKMKLSTLSKICAFEQLLLLLIKEAEKKATSKWKSFVRGVKTVIYTFMVIRILVAIYLKVKNKDA